MCLTDVETLPGRTIVIASPDARVRAHCAAQLVQRGESVISAADFKTPDIGDKVRLSAVIVIAEILLPVDASHWREIIEDHGWGGPIVILGSAGSQIDVSRCGLAYLPGPFEIETLIASLAVAVIPPRSDPQ